MADVSSSLEPDVVQDGAENGNIDSLEYSHDDNSDGKENRLKIKAKKMTTSQEASNGGGSSPNSSGIAALNNNKVQPYSKNSRKSRNGGRGLPKKGGAGGKGTWGAPGSEISETGETIDQGDPNYDSDSQEDYKLKVVTPALSDEELLKALQPVLQEYLLHGDTDEVAGSLEELRIGANRYRIIDQAISLAMERHAPHRELVSRLVSDLFGDILHEQDMMKGFDALLNSITDLSLDTPEAPAILGQFIARAVADDCLPPKFVAGYKGKMDCQFGKQALDKADVLLNMKHGMVRLDNVWGVGGGNRPVKYLKKQMKMLLKEFLSSGDKNEATRCLKELDVPHFHHEIVYEGFLMALEVSTERACDRMVDLLKYFYSANIVTPKQMETGTRRIFDEMVDVCVDVPSAYELLELMGNQLHAAGCFTEDLFRDMPSRGRKRFVSEGDGGLLKESH